MPASTAGGRRCRRRETRRGSIRSNLAGGLHGAAVLGLGERRSCDAAGPPASTANMAPEYILTRPAQTIRPTRAVDVAQLVVDLASHRRAGLRWRRRSRTAGRSSCARTRAAESLSESRQLLELRDGELLALLVDAAHRGGRARTGRRRASCCRTSPADKPSGTTFWLTASTPNGCSTILPSGDRRASAT